MPNSSQHKLSLFTLKGPQVTYKYRNTSNNREIGNLEYRLEKHKQTLRLGVE